MAASILPHYQLTRSDIITEVKTPVAVLVGPKGRGSNMAALVERSRLPESPVDVGLVIAPSPNSPALEVARGLGVATAVVPYGEDFGARLVAQLDGFHFLCLAGFMRMVPAEVLVAFPDRVLNIHPSLLPKFGGKGMYGEHVHTAVLAAGEHESGCTVHLVNEAYDEGKHLLQLSCRVETGDTPETLAKRVLGFEHQAYSQALWELAAKVGRREGQ
ncbi:MAG: phosphoribosylglycinamide formyltransferase [Fimbriimonas sp.]